MKADLENRESRRPGPHWAGLIAVIWVYLGLSSVGITIDEPLDVAPGRHYWTTLFDLGTGIFSAPGVQEAFGGNPDHPPLARWVLGAFAHTIGPFQSILFGRSDPTGLQIIAARIASASAYALTVSLVGIFAAKRWGFGAGWTAALSLMLMPHVFGHAHLAALESILNLTWLLACLAWLRWAECPNSGRAFVAGMFTGLACLTKIQGWLLIPWISVVIVFGGKGYFTRTIAFVAVATAGIWWFAGWPWMWYRTVERVSSYFLSSVERNHLNVLYFGFVYQDDALPWHFAAVQWLAAIPVPVLAAFFVGAVSAWRTGRCRTARFLTLIPPGMLSVFSLPVARYDTDRLFLVIWPSVALVAGWGVQEMLRMVKVASLPHWFRRIVWVGSVSLMAWDCSKPSPLSFVSPIVGGLQGFERAGMDLNYWGDAVDSELTKSLIERAKDGESVAVVPTLAVGQAVFMTPPELLERGIIFQDQESWMSSDWIVVYRRSAYWPSDLQGWIDSSQPLAIRTRDGVWLAGIWPGPKNRSKR